MSKTRNAVIANLTFILGQMEELKANINDTVRYLKQNPEEWQSIKDEEDSKNESQKGEEETPQ
jgi:hypothetical protein